MDFLTISKDFEDFPKFPRVAGRWSLGRSEGSSRGGGIDARGRRRRPRAQKHVRNVVSVVPTNLHGDWCPKTYFRLESQNLLILKENVYLELPAS